MHDLVYDCLFAGVFRDLGKFGGGNKESWHSYPVIPAVKGPWKMDQSNIIKAIKEVGTIKVYSIADEVWEFCIYIRSRWEFQIFS